MKENIDYVVCRICSKKLKRLSQHILQIHGIKSTEYLKRYPNSKLICEKLSNHFKEKNTGENNPAYNNARGRYLEKKRQGVKGIDYVECAICDEPCRLLSTHILRIHKMSVDEYKKKYNQPIICEDASNKLRRSMIKTREIYSGMVKEWSSKAGKRTQELHPNQSSETLKRTHQLHPNLAKENMKKAIQTMKNNGTFLKHQSDAGKKGMKSQGRNPEKMHNDRIRAGKRTHELHPNLAHECGVKVHKLHPNLARENMIKLWGNNYEVMLKASKIGGRAACRKMIESSLYVWNGVGFLSYQEMKCAKIILEEPLDGINCNVEVNGKFIDFYLEELNLFIEYHPWDWNGRTKEEYYSQRITAVNNSEYKGTNLIVITSLKEAEKISWIKEEC